MNKLLKWTKEKRVEASLKKAKENEELNRQFMAYKKIILDVCHDWEMVNNTYIRLTYDYNPKVDFMDQFMGLYRKLKAIDRIDKRNEEITWVELLENQIDNSDGMDK